MLESSDGDSNYYILRTTCERRYRIMVICNSSKADYFSFTTYSDFPESKNNNIFFQYGNSNKFKLPISLDKVRGILGESSKYYKTRYFP